MIATGFAQLSLQERQAVIQVGRARQMYNSRMQMTDDHASFLRMRAAAANRDAVQADAATVPTPPIPVAATGERTNPAASEPASSSVPPFARR
jgi:hypothetical protein